jgi:hypothetical protein
VRCSFSVARRSLFLVRHVLFLDERHTFSEACHPFVSEGKYVGT